MALACDFEKPKPSAVAVTFPLNCSLSQRLSLFLNSVTNADKYIHMKRDECMLCTRTCTNLSLIHI